MGSRTKTKDAAEVEHAKTPGSDIHPVARLADSLPKIKQAPDFTLTNQDGKRLALKGLRDKVVAITFIFASCADTCPLLTVKMAGIQDRVGPAFGAQAFFLSITVDSERDTPGVLKSYAEAYRANTAGGDFSRARRPRSGRWRGATGPTTKRKPRGDVDHTFLTSLVDQSGILRVQYMGVRFNPDEMLRDVQGLLREGKAP